MSSRRSVLLVADDWRNETSGGAVCAEDSEISYFGALSIPSSVCEYPYIDVLSIPAAAFGRTEVRPLLARR